MTPGWDRWILGSDPWRTRVRIAQSSFQAEGMANWCGGRDDASSRATVSRLHGRDVQLRRIDGAAVAALAGHGGTLRLVGPPGSGKSTLLDHASRRVKGFGVLTARMSQAEQHCPFAGLHLLFGRQLENSSGLECQERQALMRAFGLTAGRPRLADVNRALVQLVTSAAATEPMACFIDDAQWLDADSAQALGFLGRRATQMPLLMLLAEQTPRLSPSPFSPAGPFRSWPTSDQPNGAGRLGDEPAWDSLWGLPGLDGLDRVPMNALSRHDAMATLADLTPDGLDPDVAERILLESGGLPGEIIDAVGTAGSYEIAGGYRVPSEDVVSPTAQNLVTMLEALGESPKGLLLLAAAEPTGDPALWWEAGALIGAGEVDAAVLEAQHLIRFETRLVLSSPRLRSIVYTAASPSSRRAAHGALAKVTGRHGPADRHAWHAALATRALDDALSLSLSQAADAACRRGGPYAQAAFLDRASLTARDTGLRAEMALTAAAAHYELGESEAAERLLSVADSAATKEAQRAEVALQRARISSVRQADQVGVDELMSAAARLQGIEPDRASAARLEALVLAMSLPTGAYPSRVSNVVEPIARVALSDAAAERPSWTLSALLLDGLARRAVHGYASAYGPLAEAVDCVLAGSVDARDEDRLWLATCIAADLWDEKAWATLAERCSDRRGFGRSPMPARAPSVAATVHVYRGEFAAARLATAGREDNSPPGVDSSSIPLLVTAWTGPIDDFIGSSAPTHACGEPSGDAIVAAIASLAQAVAYNGAGAYAKALPAAVAACEQELLTVHGFALFEVAEAASRCKEHRTAESAVEQLEERARVAGTDWAMGVQCLARALVSAPAEAEALFGQSVAHLRRTDMRLLLGRALLLQGEWLRRRNRRSDARDPLRAAIELFEEAGASLFTSRARGELLATGETARRRNVEAGTQLTAQERRVAALANAGLTNPAIAARLYVSPRTVEYHLHKVFGKLGISARTELHLVWDAVAADAAQ